MTPGWVNIRYSSAISTSTTNNLTSDLLVYAHSAVSTQSIGKYLPQRTLG